MYKPVVGVVRGGPSAEYAVSLQTGKTVLQHLSPERFTARDILIDRAGVWHVRGLPVDPERALDHVDVVFNALHGAYGEDGMLQRLLDTHDKRYTGSGALASGLAMNKVGTKRHLRHTLQHALAGAHESAVSAPALAFAADMVITDQVGVDDVAHVFERLSPPLIVKPATGGSSIATTIVQTQDELLYAMLGAFEQSETVLVEQVVRGREVTVAVLEDWRGEDLYAFPPVEIRPTKGAYFDYAEKYEGHAEEVCPAPLPREVTEALLGAARFVHRALDLRDYSRSDFIIGKDGVYFLEVNTLPGLTPTSLVPKALEAVGGTVAHFVDHVTMRALARR